MTREFRQLETREIRDLVRIWGQLFSFVAACDVRAQSAGRIIKLAQELVTAIERCQSQIRYDLQHLAYFCVGILLLVRERWNLDSETDAQLDLCLEILRVQAGKAKYICSADFFFPNNCRWERLLAPYCGKPNLKFLEIGAFEGMATCWLLDHVLVHPSSRITVVDPFLPVEGASNDRRRFLGEITRQRQAPPGSFPGWEDLFEFVGMTNEKRFDANIRRSGQPHKVDKRVGLSQQELRLLPETSFEFVYVDGCHLARQVHEDAVLSWALLKPGGVLVFDDYAWDLTTALPPASRPYLGIKAFLLAYAGEFEVLHRGYQLAVRKKPQR